jgi:hypothetical protein
MRLDWGFGSEMGRLLIVWSLVVRSDVREKGDLVARCFDFIDVREMVGGEGRVSSDLAVRYVPR